MSHYYDWAALPDFTTPADAVGPDACLPVPGRNCAPCGLARPKPARSAADCVLTAFPLPSVQVLQGDGPGQLPPRQEVGLRPVPSHPSLAGMYASKFLLFLLLVVSFR